MTWKPRIEQPIIPDPAATAAHTEELDRMREERLRRHELEAPARRLLLGQGPELRDIEAALECSCGCHPRPAETTLHGGGTTCPCQRTEEERQQALDAFLSLSEELAPSEEELAARAKRIEAVCRELDVELDDIGGAAPFVVCGRVDGRAFVLRERHDHWTVRIAGDAEPLTCPWNGDPEQPTILVSEGSSEDLFIDGTFEETLGVRIAAAAVRTFLQRRTCEHLAAGRYCQDCGVEVASAHLWRITTHGPDSSEN